jgi:hypothetical protein
MNIPKALPLTRDIKSLREFLEAEMKSNITALAKGYCYSAWQNLLECVLIGLISFPYEAIWQVSKMLISA